MRARTRVLLGGLATALAGALLPAVGPWAGGAAAADFACGVDYTVNDWSTGFTANVTITNRGTAPVGNWTLTYSYSGNQKLQNGWNGSWTQADNVVTVKNLSWNGTVAPGASVTTGAQFSYSGSNTAPTAFTVNGVACNGAGTPPPTSPPPTSPPPSTPPGSAPALHVSGNKLADASGKTVTLHGVNRSGAEFMCVQGRGLFDGPVDAASIAAIKSWHVNAVRVPLNEDCWQDLPNVNAAYRGAAYRTAVKNYVDLLHQYGLVAILDLHWTHGVYTGTGAGCSDVNATCQKPMPDSANAVGFWTSVAQTFKGDRATVFDLFNEPYPDMAMSTTQAWQCWRDGGSACPGIGYPVAGMQSLVNAVRGTGADNVIMLGGLSWSNNLTSWLTYRPSDPQGNLAASWHSYNFNSCSSQSCWDSQEAPVAAQVPLVAGEIGENDCAHGYIDTLMSWLDTHSVSYLGWTWNTWDCSSGPVLITNYDGTPTAYGIGLRNHLAALG